MTTVYVATFSNNAGIQTVGTFRTPNQAFHAIHSFIAFRYPQFFSNMGAFPINALVRFGEDFNENEDFEPLADQFIDRFIIPFTDNRFRIMWNINVTRSILA